MRKIFSSLTAVLMMLLLSVPVFAEDGVRYSNELTSSPLRIFFAVLVIVLFVVSEILFKRFREKKVAQRNKSYEKEDKE